MCQEEIPNAKVQTPNPAEHGGMTLAVFSAPAANSVTTSIPARKLRLRGERKSALSSFSFLVIVLVRQRIFERLRERSGFALLGVSVAGPLTGFPARETVTVRILS
jgi:hypothetical protein